LFFLNKEVNALQRGEGAAGCVICSRCTDEIVVLMFQLQLWLENPMCQLTFKTALPKIEAPYNSECLSVMINST